MDDISLSQTPELTCPQCGSTFTVEIWLIVDLAERPDLAERIRESALHATPCPHCGNVVKVYAALLLYLPERDSPLLFSPAQQTTQEKDQQQASVLLGTLRERLGDAWQDQWVSQGLQSVPRTICPRHSATIPKLRRNSCKRRPRGKTDSLFPLNLRMTYTNSKVYLGDCNANHIWHPVGWRS